MTTQNDDTSRETNSRSDEEVCTYYKISKEQLIQWYEKFNGVKLLQFLKMDIPAIAVLKHYFNDPVQYIKDTRQYPTLHLPNYNNLFPLKGDCDLEDCPFF